MFLLEASKQLCHLAGGGIMMKKRTLSVHARIAVVTAAVFFTAVSAFAEGRVNLLTKAEPGDWAGYMVTRENKTIPLLGFKDQQHWRVISVVEESSVRLDEYMMLGTERTSGLGRPVQLDKPFEPIAGLAASAAVTVVSEKPETLTLAGKNYACTRIERKILQPLDEETFQPKWEGTSTIWICPDVPVGGLVKMENNFVEQLTSSSEANSIVETWVLFEFGFKDWQE
jgi:hypothetical protein